MLGLIGILGIISTILVFGIIIGLTTRLESTSRKFAVAITIVCSIGMFILTYLISTYVNTAYKFVNNYSFTIFTSISIILIFTGFYMLRKWKIYKNNAKMSQLPLIILFPCCWVAVSATMVLMYPFKEVSAAFVALIVAFFLSLVIMAFYFASETILRIIKKPYLVLLGNSTFFVGLYYLVLSIVIPNINAVLKSPMNPLNVPSIETLGCTMTFVILMVFIGFYMTKKQSDLIQ